MTAILVLLTLFLLTSCQVISLLKKDNQATTQTALTIEQVQSVGRPGIYNLTGTATLPTGTEVSVLAVRYLVPQSANSQATPPYTILARQPAQVKDHRWKSTLALWQVAPDGRYQEAWQRNLLDSSINPSADVTFMVTLDPVNQPADLQTQLTEGNKRFSGSQVRYTSEGESYLLVTQTAAIDLPTQRTTPQPTKPQDINGGWGDRNQLNDSPASTAIVPPTPIKVAPTDAPLSAEEILR